MILQEPDYAIQIRMSTPEFQFLIVDVQDEERRFLISQVTSLQKEGRRAGEFYIPVRHPRTGVLGIAMILVVEGLGKYDTLRRRVGHPNEDISILVPNEDPNDPALVYVPACAYRFNKDPVKEWPLEKLIANNLIDPVEFHHIPADLLKNYPEVPTL